MALEEQVEPLVATSAVHDRLIAAFAHSPAHVRTTGQRYTHRPLAYSGHPSPAADLHKLSLGVFSHNTAAIELYRKFGFVEEGRRIKQYRRATGELWDSIEMGLLL